MEEKIYPTTSYSASDDLLRLQGRFTSWMNWLVPAWAALCGAVASGDFDWQRADWLHLALLILLVDVGWGVLWTAMGSTDWATPLRHWRDWRSGEPVQRLPYTLPGSFGDYAARWLGQFRAWWRDVFWPTCGLSLSAIGVALVGVVVLGTLLGTNLLLLNVAVLAVIQLGIAWEGGRGMLGSGWDAIIVIALPWLAGHIAFAEALTFSSAGLALAFTLAWASAGHWLGIAAQAVAAVILVVLHSPLAAGLLLLLLAPQLILLPWLQRGQSVSWYVRYALPWMLAAMGIAAWVL
ncbi:MAG: hypothetical protein GY832_27750 [Chloroflexi bacterium]|nr:hypothetical protein [Chloroflexota bacterium]